MSANSRTNNNQGCPYCATHNSKLGYGNDLLNKFQTSQKNGILIKMRKLLQTINTLLLKKFGGNVTKDMNEAIIESRTGGTLEKEPTVLIALAKSK